jgi:hypothetical protein
MYVFSSWFGTDVRSVHEAPPFTGSNPGSRSDSIFEARNGDRLTLEMALKGHLDRPFRSFNWTGSGRRTIGCGH